MISNKITVPALCLLPLLAVMALMSALHTPITNAAPDGVQTVTTLAGSGAGSLRQTIADATAGDAIEFSVNGTIVLATELVIDKDLTINGGNVITVSGNYTTSIFNVTTGNVTFDGLVIADGSRQGNICSGSCAGGISMQNSSVFVTVTNSSLIRNKSNSGSMGGGIDNYGGTLTISNTVFSENSGGLGAGVRNDGGVLTISNSTFSNNVGTKGSGIYNEGFGTLTIDGSTFSDNSAYFGGGVYNNISSIVAIINSTFSNNSALYDGGGIENVGAMTLNNTTLFGNSAGTSGGGIYNVMEITVTNSIVANSGTGGDCNTNNTIMVTNTIIEDNGGNACDLIDGVNDNIIGQDPKLSSLASNGGATLTHALQFNSPAVDAGAGCGATDQRGIARPQGAACDIGAYELIPINFTDFVFLPVVVK